MRSIREVGFTSSELISIYSKLYQFISEFTSFGKAFEEDIVRYFQIINEIITSLYDKNREISSKQALEVLDCHFTSKHDGSKVFCPTQQQLNFFYNKLDEAGKQTFYKQFLFSSAKTKEKKQFLSSLMLMLQKNGKLIESIRKATCWGFQTILERLDSKHHLAFLKDIFNSGKFINGELKNLPYVLNNLTIPPEGELFQKTWELLKNKPIILFPSMKYYNIFLALHSKVAWKNDEQMIEFFSKCSPDEKSILRKVLSDNYQLELIESKLGKELLSKINLKISSKDTKSNPTIKTSQPYRFIYWVGGLILVLLLSIFYRRGNLSLKK